VHNLSIIRNIARLTGVDHMSWRSVWPSVAGTCLFLCSFFLTGAGPSVSQQAQSLSSFVPLDATAREAFARQILVQADGSRPADESLSFTLYRSAGAWAAIDQTHAIQLYRQAFSYARGSTGNVRAPLETAILNELLPLSPLDVENSVTDAETETKDHLFGGLINYWLVQGNYPKAVDAFDRAIAAGTLPAEAPILHLLSTLPKNASDERAHVFGALIAYCKSHPTHYKNLASWIDRFYTQLPPAIVRDAIHTVLVEAEMDDWQHPLSSIGMGSVRFHSGYDIELFTLAAALEENDPDQSKTLLAAHPEVAEALRRFPKGFESVAPNAFDYKYLVVVSHEKPTDLLLWSDPNAPLNLLPQDIGLEFSRQPGPLPGITGGYFQSYDRNGPEASVVAQLKGCPPDLAERLEEQAQAVPISRQQPIICTEHGCSYRNVYPRAELFEFVADGCIRLDAPAPARSVLKLLLGIMNQIPEKDRTPFLAQAADLYLRAGDQEAAADVIQDGFKLARAAYEKEAESEKTPRNVPPCYWEAAEIYRQMVTVGAYASLDRTREAVNEIPNAGLRNVEKVMIARALLGVPVRRRITAEASGAIRADEGTAYDNF
jgi:tetratricopeptide (TPR) repeat protein